MDDTLKPYLTYSFGLHLALAAVALKFLYSAAAPSSPVYSIDFVGPSAAIMDSRGGGAAKAAPQPPAKAPAPKNEDDFSHYKRGGALPKPSLTKGTVAPKQTKAAEEPASDAAPEQGAGGESGAPGAAGIATDLPNFPYPWYISQIRAALWDQWTKHKPAGSGEAVVSFTILPNGNMTDLRTEVSSGDSGFDLAAMGTARDAAPYPPLPKGFAEPFLKIHVTLKS